MHRNALFEAVHSFSSFFHVLFICHLFLASIMGINGYKTNGGSHKHLFTSVKLYLQLIYSQCHKTLTPHFASSHF